MEISSTNATVVLVSFFSKSPSSQQPFCHFIHLQLNRNHLPCVKNLQHVACNTIVMCLHVVTVLAGLHVKAKWTKQLWHYNFIVIPMSWRISCLSRNMLILWKETCMIWSNLDWISSYIWTLEIHLYIKCTNNIAKCSTFDWTQIFTNMYTALITSCSLTGYLCPIVSLTLNAPRLD